MEAFCESNLTTPEDLVRWANSSAEVAVSSGIMPPGGAELLTDRTTFVLNEGELPGNNWTGKCWYQICDDPELDRCIQVEIYEQGLSSFTPRRINRELRSRGFPAVARLPLYFYLKALPGESFKQFAGQTGMDHELIGHGFHYLTFKDHGERIAIETQLRMIRARGGSLFGGENQYPLRSLSILEKLGYNINWIVASAIYPPVLRWHKQEDLERER